MLVPLGHTYVPYRAYLVSGLLNAHDVEAHVQHDRAALIYGGRGPITATVWVPDEAWDDAWEILTARTEEAEFEAMVAADPVGQDYAGRLTLPPVSCVLLGVAVLWTGVNLLLFLGTLTIQWMPGDRYDIGRSLASLPFAIFVLILESLMFGLVVALLCLMMFPLIRMYKEGKWPVVYLFRGAAVILALFVALGMLC